MGKSRDKKPFSVLEICAGGGGQACGLESAGFSLAAALELDAHACNTLRHNRPEWDVRTVSIIDYDCSEFEKKLDLLAGGVPCPPFSIAGKQLGEEDERDLFPAAIKIVRQTKPKAVLLENVRGFASARFANYRRRLLVQLKRLGYVADYRILNASDFGVPQLRPRFVLVAIQRRYRNFFFWPAASPTTETVASTIGGLMAAGGWTGWRAWAARAAAIAPTIVGGSKKHGGPDLGPTRAKRQWGALGVDGLGIADAPPNATHSKDFAPKLTVEMVALIQGFPGDWKFVGGKTARYRQVGNAFPPPVARALGEQIKQALLRRTPDHITDEQRPNFDRLRPPGMI